VSRRAALKVIRFVSTSAARRAVGIGAAEQSLCKLGCGFPKAHGPFLQFDVRSLPQQEVKLLGVVLN
jgi:hypothetical protein